MENKIYKVEYEPLIISKTEVQIEKKTYTCSRCRKEFHSYIPISGNPLCDDCFDGFMALFHKIHDIYSHGHDVKITPIYRVPDKEYL